MLPLALWAVRREIHAAGIVLAGAPVLAIAAVSVTIVYDGNQGRYFTSAIALSAGVWGLAARWGATRVGLAAASVVTAGLCLVNSLGKPTGIDLLGGYSDTAVWQMPRWNSKGCCARPRRRGARSTPSASSSSVPSGASIGLALRGNDFGFPYFGPHLRRQVTIVDMGAVPRRRRTG